MTLTKGLLGLGLSLLGLTSASCSRPPTVLITVEDLPAMARSLHIIPAHMGLASLNELEPFELPQPSPSVSTFLLRLPDGLTGDITVQAAAYAESGAKGCVLSAGDNSLMELQGQDSTLRVQLKPVADSVCSGQRPLLLGASPSRGLASGDETVTLTGWGFKPGATVSFNGTAARSVTYKSATQIEVRTPARVGLGLAEIRAANKDGTAHARKDLFRFYTDLVDFGGLPINDSTTMFDIGGLVVDRLYPGNPAVLVAMAATMRVQQEVRVLRVEFPLSITDDNIDLRPLAPMGMMAVPSGIATRDMDADGIPDLIVAISSLNKVVVIKNGGNGNYSFNPTTSAFNVGSDPQGLVVTDLNGDKLADIVTANRAADTVSILMNNGQGGFMPKVDIGTDAGPVSLVVSDLDQDGDQDIIVACYTKGTMKAILGNGNGTFLEGPSLMVGSRPSYIEARDLDGDKIEDLVIVNEGSSNLTIFVNKSKGGAINPNLSNLTTSPNPQPFVLADVNGDAYDDLLVPCRGTDMTKPGVVDVFLNNKGMGFTGVTPKTFPLAISCTQVSRIATVDATSDGLLDMAALCQRGGAVLKNQSQ
jgi:hypothetical protein